MRGDGGVKPPRYHAEMVVMRTALGFAGWADNPLAHHDTGKTELIEMRMGFVYGSRVNNIGVVSGALFYGAACHCLHGARMATEHGQDER